VGLTNHKPMKLDLTNIKREAFTAEELERINDLVQKGRFELIATVVNMDDPAKEVEVAKILEQVRPAVAPIESRVQEELTKKLVKGERIESPEEELEWQKKLDEEKKPKSKKATVK
jgi:hypothetical protein